MEKESHNHPENRINELLQEISYLKKENERLKSLLADNGILTSATYASKTPDPDQGSRILPYIVNKTTANRFFSRFWGRTDVYSQRIVSRAGKVGYFPQCNNFWRNGCLRKDSFGKDAKKRGQTCLGCPIQSWKKVTPEAVMRHLKGEIVMGIYPLFPDDTCRFLAFDFDNHKPGSDNDDNANSGNEWRREVDALREICIVSGIDPLVERSRSGNGAHLWIFFEEPVPAVTARKFGDALLGKGAESVNLTSFSYYDRMLPAQDYLKDGGLGNLIALPLQPEALKNGNSAFVDGNWDAYPDQFAVLFSKPKLTKAYIERMTDEWGISSPFIVIPADENERQKPWERTSAFHSEDVRGRVRITLADAIYVDALNLAPRLQNQIRRLAAFSNPVFYKNQAMGISNYMNSRFIYLGEDSDGYISIPRGMLDDLIGNLQGAGIPFELNDERQPGRSINVSFTGNLKDNQKSAVGSMLSHDTGILSAATAFGKTVVCCALIAERKTSTLILLESSALIDQWVDSLSKFLTINEEPPEYATKSGNTCIRKICG